MEKKDIEYFKELLVNWLAELESRADSAVFELKNQADNSADILDQASWDRDRNFMLRIRSRERNLVRKIKKALENIEEGTFGICEVCGEDIAIPRLKARPVTNHCIECKSRMEAEEQKRMVVGAY